MAKVESTSTSSSDDEMDNMMIFSLTDLEHDADIEDGGGDSHHSSSDHSSDDRSAKKSDLPPQKRPVVSLRQRRRSRLGFEGEFSRLNINLNEVNRYQSVDSGFDELHSESGSASVGSPKVSAIWLKALKKIKTIKDPWENFHIEKYDEEVCTRYRYNAMKKEWREDTVNAKMETEEFNRGAMRACFRMKKLSSFTRQTDWRRAYNYVAKKYMEDVDREVYFEDVKLQMDAKLWGEEYNRHNPPKKVDIMQMCVIEFKNRPGSSLYHLEHFIEGKYIKYNSNSGFVDESLRFTPQAFSHFTFEKSGHEMIVVDIQGVGDLWTDPQIHTAHGSEYGDGNLGTHGMALFFHSHQCNSICHGLNLSGFDLSPQEIADQGLYRQANMTGHTATRGTEEIVLSCPGDRTDLNRFLSRQRIRHTSNMSDIPDDYSESDSYSCSPSITQQSPAMQIRRFRADPTLERIYAQSAPQRSGEDAFGGRMLTSEDEPMSPDSTHGRPSRTKRVAFGDSDSSDLASSISRFRTMSEMSESSEHGSCAEEEEAEIFRRLNLRNHRASCVADEINYRKLNNLRTIGDSVLGLVHHELAKYHELGRFTKDENKIDWKAALFHESIAADLGVMEAIVTVAKLHLGHQPDVLVNCVIEENDANMDKGVDYMELAAELGDRPAMLYMARAYESGSGLGNERTASNKYAYDWYEQALHYQQEDEDGGFDATVDNPSYQIKAKMAELLLAGGPGLDTNPSRAGELYNEAAEEAMAAFKGKLSNKYYALAEEAWVQCPEEEDEGAAEE